MCKIDIASIDQGRFLTSLVSKNLRNTNFNLMFNSLKLIKCEKDLKSEYISDSIISQFTWISPALKKDRIRNTCTFLHLFAMRIGIWAIGFDVTHFISSDICQLRYPCIQFDRLRRLWHYCCSFSTWSIEFRQRHSISTWLIEFRQVALGFDLAYFI